jgi:hypothetical protein
VQAVNLCGGESESEGGDHAYHYVASVQNQQIGDVTGHAHGFIRYAGLANSADGSTARTTVFNAFDGIAGPGGGGTVNGYENVIFGDSSELRLKYTGTYKNDNKGWFQGAAPTL